MKTIGFIGVGIMGKSMVRNLMKAGFTLHIYARTRAKVEDVIDEGALFYEDIGSCVKDCDAVITMVGYPEDVEEVYLAEGNIFERARAGAYCIDMTTSSPNLAKQLYAKGKALGLHVLDAPVTGGDVGAKNGTLSILVGGEEEDFKACLPLFKAMGTNIQYEGKAGNGQHTKMVNQIMIAANLSGVCEALSYARKKELDLDAVLAAVSSGAAGSRQLELLGSKILAGDFNPGFFVKHFVKDMRLAAEEAEESGLKLDILLQVLKHYQALETDGWGDLGTQALIKHYEE